MVVAGLIPVMGALTALNLSSNHIGGHYRNGKMVHTPEGPKAVADALLVNGVLTECNLSGNDMRDEEKASIRFALQGKAGFKLHLR